jgi:hypothetical protein
LEAGGVIVAGADDPRDAMERGAELLEGRTLATITLTCPAPDVCFAFDRKVLHKLFPFHLTGQHTDWALYMPDDRVLVLGGEPGWRVVPKGAHA